MVHLYDALHGSQSRGTLDARRISKISAEQYWDKLAVPPKPTSSLRGNSDWPTSIKSFQDNALRRDMRVPLLSASSLTNRIQLEGAPGVKRPKTRGTSTPVTEGKLQGI